jgi:hypothetical protein
MSSRPCRQSLHVAPPAHRVRGGRGVAVEATREEITQLQEALVGDCTRYKSNASISLDRSIRAISVQAPAQGTAGIVHEPKNRGPETPSLLLVIAPTT